MDHLRCLTGYRLHQIRMAVTQCIDGHTRHGVEILTASLVVQPYALAMSERDRLAAIGIHQMRHLNNSATLCRMHFRALRKTKKARRLAPPCLIQLQF
jgi:hypothetical protein